MNINFDVVGIVVEAFLTRMEYVHRMPAAVGMTRVAEAHGEQLKFYRIDRPDASILVHPKVTWGMPHPIQFASDLAKTLASLE